MVLILMTGWDSQVADIKGSFLNEKLGDADKMYMHVPQSFEKY